MFSPTAIILAACLAGPAEVDTLDPAIGRSVAVAVLGPDGTLEEQTDLLALERRLNTLGTNAMPHLFSLLQTRTMPREWSAPEAGGAELDGGRTWVLRRRFSRFPLGPIRSFLRAIASEPFHEEQRFVALVLLGDVGEGEDLRLVFQLAQPGNPELRVPRRVREAFGDALARLLGRSPQYVHLVQNGVQTTSPELLDATVQALASIDPKAAVSALSECLGARDGLDAQLLFEIAHRGTEIRGPVDSRVAKLVREYLVSDDPALVRLAARAAGAIDDFDAVGRLVELAHESDPNLVESATMGLGQLTGLRFGDDVDRWDTWYSEELRWWRGESKRALRDLDDRDATVALEAIRAVSRRDIHRHTLSAELAACLNSQDEAVFVLACAGLGELGSWSALVPLAERVSGRGGVRSDAALAALRRITGKDLGADPEAWMELGP